MDRLTQRNEAGVAAYRQDVRFKEYVDKYANKHKITPQEAVSHELVKQVCMMYMEAE